MQALPPTQQRYTQEMMTLQPPSFAETRVETLNAELSVSGFIVSDMLVARQCRL